MLMKIVGVQPQKYHLDNGYAFEGNKIHAIDLDTKPNGILGNIVTDFKIPVTSPLYAQPIDVGSVYKCYFTQKGELDFMMLTDDPSAPPFPFVDEPKPKK